MTKYLLEIKKIKKVFNHKNGLIKVFDIDNLTPFLPPHTNFTVMSPRDRTYTKSEFGMFSVMLCCNNS